MGTKKGQKRKTARRAYEPSRRSLIVNLTDIGDYPDRLIGLIKGLSRWK